MHLTAVVRRLSAERGIALPAVMGMMLVMGLLTAAVISTAQSDVPQARRDQDRKQALAAAEAGVNAYMYKLQRDSEAWTQCTSLSGTPFVNQPWSGSGADPRAWRNVPGSTSQYTVELIPKAGQSTCSTSDPAGTMISNAALRIRATGRSRGSKRSIIAKFRKRSFLDYLYYTDYETLDPAWYTRAVNGAPTDPDITAWATANCKYYRDGRASKRYSGVWYDALNRPTSFTDDCSEIQFAPSDQVRGPMHTNDEYLVCRNPTFGRTVDDAIEASAPAPAWRSNCSSSYPNFVGTWTPAAPLLTMPPANDSLRDEVLPAYLFTGRTTIVLSASNITVNGTSMPYPANGLIYVQNGSCGQGYKPYDPYNSPLGCADVFVKGTYGSSLTIASQKDIIITNDVLKSGGALMGLIANDFIRVYHPIRNLRDNGNTCDTDSSGNPLGPTPGNIQIDSSLMALNHSFMVDNYFCGGPQGTLTVTGSIIQKYRGPVGQGGSSITNGYIKDYSYDDEFRYRQPPLFLDPIQSSWRLLSMNEQVPAR
jgi:Tfp pilus assembly protein PilX